MFRYSISTLKTKLTRSISSTASAGNKWGVSRARTLDDIRAALNGRSSVEVLPPPQSQYKGKGKAQTPLIVPEEHLKHRKRMKERFPDGWNPPRKLSREAMDGLRALHAHDPQTFTTPVLAERFRVSPEAVRRMLRSRWMPKPEERAKLLEKERRRRVEYKDRRIEREREKEREWEQRREREERERGGDGFELQ